MTGKFLAKMLPRVPGVRRGRGGIGWGKDHGVLRLRDAVSILNERRSTSGAKSAGRAVVNRDRISAFRNVLMRTVLMVIVQTINWSNTFTLVWLSMCAREGAICLCSVRTVRVVPKVLQCWTRRKNWNHHFNACETKIEKDAT